ncbi:MAG: DUF1015 domain-containing protein [Candidatus Omnitrophota bacterium]
MAKIKPFKAVVYNQEKVKDLSNVLCPPYDVISQAGQRRYQSLSPYNFIHILLGRDIPGDDKYQRAAKYFNTWQKSRILIQDEKPAIYFYSQQFSVKGVKMQRLGFISLLELTDSNPTVFGHEHTRLEPKEDRARLLKKVKASLSPIFAIFTDKERLIQQVYKKYIENEAPFITVTDEEKVVHKLWRVDSPEVIAKIQDKMENENIFIADGHHRYEVACAYRQERNKRLKKIADGADYNYILAYFTSTDPRSLSIFPIHRLVKLSRDIDMQELKDKLQDYFDAEEVREKSRFFFSMEKGGRTEHLIGAYKDKKFLILRLKNIKMLDKLMGDKPEEYRTLDVAILNHIVLKSILGLNPDDKESIIFMPNAEEVISRVDLAADPYIAFLLNPAKIEQIIAVALRGQKMPSKSTYFYPKVLSGMVVNKFK